jgi:transcriptional regulator with XRE-family HTH domain
MGFRENLREALDFSGLEQKELAYKSNISLRNIENYLRENASIPLADKAVRIAQSLGVSVEYLVTGENMPQDTISSLEPDLRKLIQNIKKLQKNEQFVVIQNALNLINIILKQR